jgi:hypothetical protein
VVRFHLGNGARDVDRSKSAGGDCGVGFGRSMIGIVVLVGEIIVGQ